MPHRQTPSVEADEDGEGEEDDANEEDKNLYCFCQKLSYGTVGIRCRRCQRPWLTISRPQMVGCDDEHCRYQWVMSIPCPRAPLIALNTFYSFMWGALVSKIPQRAVGTVLSALNDAVRNARQGHRGEEGKKTLVTDVFFCFLCYRTCVLCVN